MKKLLLVIIFIISSLFYSSIYASNIIVKIPINLHSVISECSEEINADWVYTCTIESWFWSINKWIWQIIKYFTFITWLAWVLYIIINWIMLSMAWMNDGLKAKAKENITKTLLGLILLLLSWLILNIIAPWVYT